MKWPGHVSRKETQRSAYRILVRNPEIKNSLGVPRHRQDDHIKMDLENIG
jgi:hypothetical protein